LEKDALLVRLLVVEAILAKASEVEVVCCWLLLLIMCEAEVASLDFDATWSLLEAAMAEVAEAAMAEVAEAAETVDADFPVNANKLALNGLASTMPLLVPPTLYFDDKACCWVEVAAIEAEAVIEDDDLTSLLLLASYFIEDIFCSLDIEAISAVAVAAMVEAIASEGAVLGRCLHLCRLQNFYLTCQMVHSIELSIFHFW